MSSNLIMTLAAFVLASVYLASTGIHLYVGWIRHSLLKTYWTRAAACTALAVNQAWVLVAGPSVVQRIFGLTWAIVLATTLVRSAMIAYRERPPTGRP